MATTSLILPDDHAELLAEARLEYPALTKFTHASDCVMAQDHLSRFVHIPHKRLRARRAERLKAARPAAAKLT